jgi:rubrerythrin
MPLENFGSILNFAEELESRDREFYTAAATNPQCASLQTLFSELAADAERNVVTVERLRRENVTEMILEPVQDFKRADFCEDCEKAPALSAAQALETATRLEARADRYYSEAAEKLKVLTEVSRTLKTLGKIRKTHIARLMNVKR